MHLLRGNCKGSAGHFSSVMIPAHMLYMHLDPSSGRDAPGNY